MSFTADIDGDIFFEGPGASNGLIFGHTGMGKSFLLKHILSKFLTRSDKNRVILITFGGSYEKICKLLDGQYFQIDADWISKRKNEELPLKAEKRFIVFDLRYFYDGVDFLLREVMSAAQGMLNDSSLQNLIIFDEAWQVLSNEMSTGLVNNLYRDAHKWNASILIASEDPGDLLRIDAGQNILANSRIRIFSRDRFYEDEMLKRLGLSDEEIETIKYLQSEKKRYQESLLKYGARSMVICFEPTQAEFWTYTTHPEDVKIENKFRADHPDYTEAQIIEGLAEKH
jgi:type IV secretory pathway VirB4 component